MPREMSDHGVRAGREAALAAFEARHVVGRAEPGRPEERDEILVALLAQFRRVVARQGRPGVDLDVVGRQRIPGADRVPIRDQDQVREDEQVAVEVGDVVGPLGADFSTSLARIRASSSFGAAHDRRPPLRILDDAMPAAQRQADAPLPARAEPALRVGADVGRGTARNSGGASPSRGSRRCCFQSAVSSWPSCCRPAPPVRSRHRRRRNRACSRDIRGRCRDS